MPKHTRRSRERTVEPSSSHHHQHQHLLLEALQAVFRLDLSDERLSPVVIVAVELSVDESSARVAWAAREENPQTGPAIERASPFIRTQLCSSLGWKRVPKLRFVALGTLAGETS